MPRYPLEKLGASPHTYDFFDTRARDWTPLLAQGLYPPLPVSGEDLVWGFPILDAAGRSGLKELACVELDPSDRSALLDAALRLENRRGGYRLEEQARLYDFMTGAGLADEPGKAASLIDLITERQPAAWLREMGEYAALPDGLRRLAAERVLDVKTAARTRSLPPAFFDLLDREKERFSFSERRRLALLFWEITRRDRPAPEAAEALANGLFSDRDPWPRLLALRYPGLTGLEKKLAAITDGLEREGVAVRPPAGFEGEEFSFSFTAASRAAYGRRLAALARFEEQVDRLFELL